MKRILFAFFALAVSVIPSLAAFSENSFNYGRQWEGSLVNANLTGLSHIAMYVGDGTREAYNPYWEGEMVKTCKKNGLTPVFYAYVIAEWDKHFGFKDCDVGSPNHCTNGAETIRNEWSEILSRYKDLAKGVANDFGTNDVTIWLIEPDFFQYSVSGDQRSPFNQVGGGIPDAELAGRYFNEIVATIKSVLPNAKIAVDISPWLNNDIVGWYANFDKSKVDYLFTSGGRTQGGQERIRNDNNNLLTWAYASAAMGGKKIIADDGYGVGGASNNDYEEWMNVSNLRNRIADGVIGITIQTPSNSFYEFARNNPLSIGNTPVSSSGNNPASSSSVNSSSSVAPTNLTALIDNFEDSDYQSEWGGEWTTYTDNRDGGQSTVTPTLSQGYNSTKALKISYSLNKGSLSYDPQVGISIDLNEGKTSENLSACSEISYYYKGAAHTIRMETPLVTDYSYHESSAVAANNWTKKTVSLSSMTQPPWSNSVVSVANAKSNVKAFSWQVSGTSGATGTLEIDNIRCEGLTEPSSSSSVVSSSSAVPTVFTLTSNNATQEITAGQAIAPIVYSYSNVTNIQVAGLPQGLSGALNEGAKTFTISGTVDASLGTKDYAYTITVTGVDENKSASGIIKVTRAPVVTTFTLTSNNATQEITAGQAIAPIVYSYSNVTNIQVAGLPQGLSGALNEGAKTFTISGTVDASLGTKDYAYTITVTGVDENKSASGIIKVQAKPESSSSSSAEQDDSSSSQENPESSSSSIQEEPSSSSIQDDSSSSAEQEDSSSSSVQSNCIAFVNGVGGYGNNCYNSGLNDMESGKCYTMNPERTENPQWINESASQTYWWVETPCSQNESSSSTEQEDSSSSQENPESSSSSIQEESSSSSIQDDSSSSAEQVDSSSSQENPESSSSSIQEEPSSSSTQDDSSSSAEQVDSSSSQENPESSSSSIQEESSSSSTQDDSSSSAEQEDSSSSQENPESSSSSIQEEPSSSSIQDDSSSSSIQDDSSSSAEQEDSSSSSVQSNCIAFVNGVGSYSENCYDSGLDNMESGKCYTLNPERESSTQWISQSARDTYWWVETPCSQNESSSSAEQEDSSSSQENPESSSSTVQDDSSSSSYEESPETSSSEGNPFDGIRMASAQIDLKTSLQGRILNIYAEHNGLVKIQVFDMLGNVVISQLQDVKGVYSVSLDNLKQGNYVVRLIKGQSVRSTRIIIR